MICLSSTASLWDHGLADTVRFRGRGLIVDRALSTGHNRIIRGGAVMPFTCCFVPACRQAAHMSTISFWGVSLRTGCERCQVRQRTWKQQSHSTCAADNNTSWLLPRGVQCVDWVPEPEVLCAPSSCLNIALSAVDALAVERHPLFIKVHFVAHATRNDVRGLHRRDWCVSQRGRKVVRRAASYAPF